VHVVHSVAVYGNDYDNNNINRTFVARQSTTTSCYTLMAWSSGFQDVVAVRTA
jgi:hypothetical protein